MSPIQCPSSSEAVWRVPLPMPIRSFLPRTKNGDGDILSNISALVGGSDFAAVLAFSKAENGQRIYTWGALNYSAAFLSVAY